MFSIGFWELVVTVLIAVIVIKPEDIPTISYKAGAILRRLKHAYSQFQDNLKKPLLDYDSDKTDNSNS